MASASDDFNRANGGLGSNWTVDEGSWSISSNQALAGSATQNTARWTGSSFTADHYSEAKIATAGSEAGVATRVATNQGYLLYARTEPTGNWELYRYAGGGSYTSIASGSGAASGDTFRLESNGSTHKVFRNGVQQGSDINDATFATGGVAIQTFNVHTLDDWAGGDLGAPTGRRLFLN